MEEINFIRPQEVFNRNTGESKVRYTSYDGSNKFIPVVDGEDGVPRTLVVTTHAELKAMRDGGKLTAGALYRITDYVTTTSQENTRSAGHQFDVIVLALDGSTLSEEAWAMLHDGDEYFANSNLNGWRLLYSLDNDAERFAWADPENGKGVIYRLIDEWNIDYPCDFKNMQTLVPMDSDDNIAMENPITSKYCYVFTDNTSGEPEDLSIKGHAINIKVKANLEGETSAMYYGPGTFFYTNHNDAQFCIFSDIIVGKADSTAFISSGHAINILDDSSNVILKDCETICIGYHSRNIMLDTVTSSTFGSVCENMQIANKEGLNYGNNGVELATKDDIGDIETALNNI